MEAGLPWRALMVSSFCALAGADGPSWLLEPSLTPAARTIVSELRADPSLRHEVVQALLGDMELSQAELRGIEQHRGRLLGGAAGSAPTGQCQTGFHSIFELTCHPADGYEIPSSCAYWDWTYFGFWLLIVGTGSF